MMSNKMIVFGLCLLMACTLFIRDAEAKKYISYKSLGRFPCGKYSRENCKEENPSNGYQRGCSPEDHCRDGNKNWDKDNKEDDKDKDED
ncbi:hypothetical protein EZV62_020700 [Acer yangbiense]|uniref:Uncharacterized protein n=1 Tax=Acer yangbiense TaxID=1000413 RepID=A0A5C7HEL0_9ROSI|nr:hypothetical protein EZV62_020700 [Acer yangbiense]